RNRRPRPIVIVEKALSPREVGANHSMEHFRTPSFFVSGSVRGRYMKRKWLLGCGLPLVIVVLLGFFGAKALLKSKPKEERSETVQRGDVEIKVVETGTIEPLRKVDVKSKVGGRILRLFVDEGAVVKQGQILATIDPQEINSQVAAVRAQLAAAEARL